MPWQWFRPAAPGESVPHWHVSPGIDVCAYAFSWLWLLIPLTLMGPDRADYLVLYIVSTLAIDVHRHFGLPYVYLDAQVRHRFPWRFSLVSIALFAAWMASPLWARDKMMFSPLQVAGVAMGLLVLLQIIHRDGTKLALRAFEFRRGVVLPYALAAVVFEVGCATWSSWAWIVAGLVALFVIEWQSHHRKAIAIARAPHRLLAPIAGTAVAAFAVGASISGYSLEQRTIAFRSIYAGVATIAILWNFWHVYMQKYGILRLYNAKSSKNAQIPGWVDRMLVFAWLPLFFTWLGPKYRELALKSFSRSRGMLRPFLDYLSESSLWLIPLSVGFLCAALATWIYFEWRVHRFRHAPRLWMAGGTMALNACFLFIDPVKAYLAFAFSHAIEYMVFVWAYQRRRYADTLEHRPLLGTILSKPWLAYLSFVSVLGLVFFFLSYFGRTVFPRPAEAQPALYGIPTAVWISYWGIYQSIQHFYFDGFLWKMRIASNRATI